MHLQVEARIPLFHGSDSAASAKLLIDNHSYHYSMQFGDDNTPKPVQHKPYQGNIIVNIMKSRYFNGSKLVGVVFAHKFTEIAKNKANQPEVSIPMVALTSTSVYAALFWKAQGSPPKFNFTGNQFSEVYIFHVQFLEDLKKNAPQKFHKLMVDIFATIEYSCRQTNSTILFLTPEHFLAQIWLWEWLQGVEIHLKLVSK
ncbi:hypothetical protein BD769DRAFT_1681486 [Suillus cothurnatus]|nr:hypothetical protein BD769DRAFT_1681486 [Suillus cothurnatus]